MRVSSSETAQGLRVFACGASHSPPVIHCPDSEYPKEGDRARLGTGVGMGACARGERGGPKSSVPRQGSRPVGGEFTGGCPGPQPLCSCVS